MGLQDFHDAIDQHFERRVALRLLRADFVRCAHRLQMLGVPIGNARLDTSLGETYAQLRELSEKIEQAQRMLNSAANVLSCVANLILELIRYSVGLDDENYALLHAFFSLNAMTFTDIGWEE